MQNMPEYVNFFINPLKVRQNNQKIWQFCIGIDQRPENMVTKITK